MKKYTSLFLLVLCTLAGARAQTPLYIVNGTPRTEIGSIPPDQIESVTMLPADEETIAQYGPGAAHGVVLVTLRFDRDAVFTGGDGSFTRYIAAQVAWDAHEPAARVIVRYTIAADGKVSVDKVLESTDRRLRRRVLHALDNAPAWLPATRNGTPVATQRVLRIELPEGKQMPEPAELVLR